MTTTTKLTVEPDVWTELSSGFNQALVQIVSEGQVSVHIGSAEPEGDWDEGFLIGHKVYSIGFANVAETDVLFVRARNATETIILAHDGVAPT